MLQKLLLRVVQKTAETTRNLIWNKIADIVTSAGKTKNKGKEKEVEMNEIEETSINYWCFKMFLCLRHHIKMEYQKLTNLLDKTPDNVPRFITAR